MQITKEFLRAEITSLEQERRNAHDFVVKSSGVIEAYKMLLSKLDEPEVADKPVVSDDKGASQ
jgi:hypothetical protein